MSFASALDRLAALGAELAAPNAARRKFDLAHMRTLVRALGDPQLRFRSVLIAGTNGKGSTAATLAHILAAAGLRTALYTSPHLTRVTERIRTNTAGSSVALCGANNNDPQPPFAFHSRRESASPLPSTLPAVSSSDHRHSEEQPPFAFHSRRESGSPLPPASAPTKDVSFRPESRSDAAEKPAFVPATESRSPTHPTATTPQFPNTLPEIPEPTFARLFFQVDETAQRLVAENQLPHPPSYFETLTALAFLYFAEQQIDLAVLEVGLGGRLDATNIVDPLISVITDIALDHQDYLGPTIRDIAREKAGILRPDGILITLPQHPEANQSIGEAAVPLNVRAINAADYLPGRNFPRPSPSEGLSLRPEHEPGAPSKLRLGSSAAAHATITPPAPDILSFRPEAEGRSGETCSSAPAHAHAAPQPTTPLPPNTYTLHLDNQPLHIASPLPGEHQQRNLALAVAAAVELRTHHGYAIPNAAIESGIANTAWPGRLEFLPPNLLLDVAHNPAGAWTLRAALARLPESQPRTLLFSCLRDKDLREIAQILFPLFDSPTPPSPPRTPDFAIPNETLSFRPEAEGRSGETRSSAPAQSPPPPHHHIILTAIDNPRAATLAQLTAAAQALDIPALTAPTPAEALTLARAVTPSNGLIVATGSIYLIGALRDLATQSAGDIESA